MHDCPSDYPVRKYWCDALVELRTYLGVVIRVRYPASAPNTQDVEDLIQDVCLRALRAIDTFRGGGTSQFRGWVRSILDRCATDRLRCGFGRAAVPLPESTMHAASPNPLDDIIAAEEANRMWAVVRRMSATEREVIEAVCAGVSVTELAVKLAVTEVAARKRRTRALNRLRGALADGITP